MVKQRNTNSDFKIELSKQFFKGKFGEGEVLPSVKDALIKYFSAEGERYTGSQFEYVINSVEPNSFTERDLIAVSLLNVDIPARAALWILSPEGQSQTSALLREIPVGIDLWHPDAANVFADDGKLDKLWKLLGNANWPEAAPGGGLGGTTKRSKLIAAKRPQLVPVLDRVVKGTLSQPENYWRAFQESLSDNSFRMRLEEATNVDGVPSNVCLLRRIDVVIWMNNHKRFRKPKK